jgi:hypothetical protein
LQLHSTEEILRRLYNATSFANNSITARKNHRVAVKTHKKKPADDRNDGDPRLERIRNFADCIYATCTHLLDE